MDAAKILHSLAENLLTPIPMCFALGVFCKLIHGGIKIPKELYYSISIFLLMSIGFIGGHELAKEVMEHGISTIWLPALVTFILGCLTPISAYVVLRKLGNFSVADSAGIAAHYGSTSAVTYAVADVFANQSGSAPNSFLPTLVTILECPGIAIALAMGAVFSKMQAQNPAPGETLLPAENGAPHIEKEEGRLWEALYEVVTGQSIMLMAGLLVIGFIATFTMSAPPAAPVVEKSTYAKAKEGSSEAAKATPETEKAKAAPTAEAEKGKDAHAPEADKAKAAAPADHGAPAGKSDHGSELKMAKGFIPFHDFFYSKGMIFRGALCIFLLEMGLVAGARIGDLFKVGPFLLAFGIIIPLIHGFFGAWLGHLAGLNLGGCTVFAAIVSSASYIAAPPAVRLTLPDANPTLSITAALAITFPFNIAFGIPIYYQMAKMLGAH